MADTPSGMKLKLSGISGQRDVSGLFTFLMILGFSVYNLFEGMADAGTVCGSCHHRS